MSEHPPPVTLYWRPGCGFCHVLRRALDRRGVERTEVNIWEDPDAAVVVRSHAHGNETVPTVVVDGKAMVNPSAWQVVAALGPDWRPHPSRVAASVPWQGAFWSLGIAALWVGLAASNPGTTYHLSPALVVLAWPFAARHARAGRRRAGLLATAGGFVVAVGTAVLLAGLGALDGPTLIGRAAWHEVAVVTAAATGTAVILTMWLGREHHGSGQPEAETTAPSGR